MTPPLGRKNRHGVVFTLISLGLGNVSKSSPPRVYNQIPRNFEHKLKSLFRK